MQFEYPDLCPGPARSKARRRVWDGHVCGNPECWVVVVRDERELVEWDRCEELALDSAPLRICRAILEDDVLVLQDSAAADGSDRLSDLP